jgi:segregation and condensation protein B
MRDHSGSHDWYQLSTAMGSPCGNYGWHAFVHASDSFRTWLLLRRFAAADSAAAAESVVVTRRGPKTARLEAVLLIADGPLTTRRLAQLSTLVDAAEAARLIETLNTAYDATDSAFRIERVATGFQMLTRPIFARWLDKLHHRQSQLKLSSPAMETLTIVAYRQPVTRADVEEIRGVQCAEMLKQLMERGLARVTGHDDSLGRPYLYGTTRRFLELFGLRTLTDLPMADRLRCHKPSGQIVSEGVDETSPTDADSDTPVGADEDSGMAEGEAAT